MNTNVPQHSRLKMRPLTKALALTAFLAGCESATNTVEPSNSNPGIPLFTAAGGLVDPNTPWQGRGASARCGRPG